MPKLTKRLVEATQPRERDTWLADTEVAGFALKVTPRGLCIYIARYRTDDGTQRKYTIGRHGQLTVEQARDKARQVIAEALMGGDPAGARAKARAGATVRELRDRYMAEHAEPYKKAASQDADERIWRLHILPALGGRKVSAVTGEDVKRLHASMRDTPYQANRALALLSKAFNLAEGWGMPLNGGMGGNPCRHIRRYAEHPRQRILQEAELQALGTAMQTVETERHWLWRGIAALRLWLFTGCRMREILHARWEWIDWDRAVLALPDSKTGGKLVNLAPAALAILRALPRSGAYIIPGDIDGRPMNNPRKTVALVMQLAGLKGVRIHDMRHCFGSYAHRSGGSLRDVATLLGHKQLSTAEIYTHGLGSDAERVAAATADKIAGLLQGGTKGAAGNAAIPARA